MLKKIGSIIIFLVVIFSLKGDTLNKAVLNCRSEVRMDRMPSFFFFLFFLLLSSQWSRCVPRAKSNISERLLFPRHQLEVSGFHRNSETLFDQKETEKLTKPHWMSIWLKNLLERNSRFVVLPFCWGAFWHVLTDFCSAGLVNGCLSTPLKASNAKACFKLSSYTSSRDSEGGVTKRPLMPDSWGRHQSIQPLFNNLRSDTFDIFSRQSLAIACSTHPAAEAVEKN